jgi:hypothetical protein
MPFIVDSPVRAVVLTDLFSNRCQCPTENHGPVSLCDVADEKHDKAGIDGVYIQPPNILKRPLRQVVAAVDRQAVLQSMFFNAIAVPPRHIASERAIRVPDQSFGEMRRE